MNLENKNDNNDYVVVDGIKVDADEFEEIFHDSKFAVLEDVIQSDVDIVTIGLGLFFILSQL